MTLAPIIEAVRHACQITQALQHDAVQGINKFSQAKNSSEPVTIGDYAAQALIGRALMQYYPTDAVIAEESGVQFASLVSAEQQQIVIEKLAAVLGETITLEMIVTWLDFGKENVAARTWVIDPIDGTKGFIAQRHYAICIGSLENGIPTDAVMGCPHYGAGEGAIFSTDNGALFQQSIHGGDIRPVRVAQRTQPSDWIAVQSYEDAARGKRDAEKVLKEAGLIGIASIREIDSMEKYALVACGDADMMIRLPDRGRTSPHMIWDHVAGIALVLAGGGIATDYDGKPLDFTQGKAMPNQGMIVSSGIMHDQLVQIAMQLSQ